MGFTSGWFCPASSRPRSFRHDESGAREIMRAPYAPAVFSSRAYRTPGPTVRRRRSSRRDRAVVPSATPRAPTGWWPPCGSSLPASSDGLPNAGPNAGSRGLIPPAGAAFGPISSPAVVRRLASRLPAKVRRRASRLPTDLRYWVEEPFFRESLKGRALHPYWRTRFHEFGARSVIHRPTLLRGAHKIAIGDDVWIYNAWLAVERSAWKRSSPALRIGDRVGIRPFCTVAAAESIVLEDDVSISSHSMVVDFEHRLDGPTDSFATNPLITAPVRIGRGSGIAERCAVLAGSNIGKFCLIGTNSVVHGDIPDYSIAVGAPARVIGRTRDPES